ncbi:heavy metal translocating P-type ATPase [Caulobacter sp. NIBR1757]|uniref:heavy metal translocating P-type ATPase n=1 Tax=Caulobacter sp. NIBR1757 TaxID=3016000 RepID=UPI0022EFEA83|nr:heavy metal translocating P-type ATPase [Caulobacter sp. NIBR1757]WGM38322.1 putative copper-importing P-type ATPase A [Caulobacter sp. NIBR1757]
MTELSAGDLSAFIARDSKGSGRLELLVRGASCAGCMGKIERGVAALPGVAASRFNLTTGKLTVTLAPGQGDPAAVQRAVEAMGYGASLFDPARALQAEDKVGRELALALGVAAFGAGNVMMFTVPAWAGLFGQELSPATRQVMYWLAAIVATPCALFAGMTFFRSAWASLRRGKANMDVPISIGVLLTLAVSFSETLQHGAHAYFDAAVTLLFLLLIGRYLDHRLKSAARGAARDLLALQAPVAMRLDEAGREHGVPVGEVEVGDLLAVAAGDRIPVDALVESGASDLDNALISGETATVAASPGVAVQAGALNLSGRLVLRAVARSEDSAVAAIARLMEAGAQARGAYVRLADKAAALYVPVVHTVAAATFLGGWALGLGPREALLRAAAVLIVTCPCALGLAVPAVQVAASGRLFRRGVLVKSGAALERLAEVDHVVFDKTGVLTEGRPRLLSDIPAVITAAAPLARASRHPLARALAERAGEGPVAEDVVEVAGQGVEGLINGRRARLGRAEFVGVEPSPSGESELWFGFEGETKVRLTFFDPVRADAARAVSALRQLGLTVEILSGDVAGPVARVAKAAGITQWRAGLTPFDKSAAVTLLQGTGRKVLMIGDGLNDAAALALAHASMAPGSALDASQNAADLVFLNGELSAAPLAIRIARAARSRALENFGFSALYNAVAAPAAVLGLINPFVAAIAMSGSSMVVMLNALRMTWAGRDRA